MNRPSSPNAAARLDGLERDLCRSRWIVAAAFAGVGLLLVTRTHLFRPPGEFVLRDRAGQIRARLALADDGSPGLTFFDPRGRNQVQIEATGNGTSRLHFFDGGRPRMWLETAGTGPASLFLFGTRGEATAALCMGPDGTGGLEFSNHRLTGVVGIQPDGLGGLYVADRDGTERARYGSLPVGVTYGSLGKAALGQPIFQAPGGPGPRRSGPPESGLARRVGPGYPDGRLD